MLTSLTPNTSVLDQILERLQDALPNSSDIPVAISYERNPDTLQLEWAAYIDHKTAAGHIDIHTTAPTWDELLKKVLHRVKREIPR